MDALVIGAVTIGAAAFRGVTGFGYALVAALGFAGIFSPTGMVPFILINDLMLTGFTVVDRGRSPIDWPVTRILIAAGLLGALCGSLLVPYLEGDLARILVSATIVVAACTALIRQPPVWLAHKAFGIVIGFVTGILLSAFAVGGPLIAAWLLAGGVKRDYVRGTLAVFFGLIDLFTLASRAYMGAVDAELLRLLMIYCPLTLAGFAAGYFLSHRLPASVWDRVSGVGLIFIAIVGLAQTVYAIAFA
ncbi:putative membrane protein YfcA [Pararhizobium capsulatum DSM 1112]|uniref:Probable membrane transporter protein n=1 Tax=Pararhizobium capsulatum DSM 1112 TaxID=1121113 RepID=A0ABU0BVH4_9HYPH|nr:sulfite exporter TauE/SafE family protein [Pararhizobium capsulatum]MDQ0322245.1 putative membrane protein YfcA [Pararhizobium capsulatum DSM 1112]